MGAGEEFRVDSVQGFLHRAEEGGDGMVLTHGAGANCQSALLKSLSEAFCAAGITVLRCDLPFRQARPYGPPPRGSAERDQEGLRAAIMALRKICSDQIFLGGHSYGGRQGSMLAASDPSVADGLLLLSYPLHPPQKPEQLRTAHFPSLRSTALFVSGDRDGFGTREELKQALKTIPGRTELLVVAGAGHELITAKNRAELPGRVVESFLGLVKV